MAMEVEGDNMSLSDAIAATQHLTLRELPAHVHVGPLPVGSVTPICLPLKEFLVCLQVSSKVDRPYPITCDIYARFLCFSGFRTLLLQSSTSLI